ncbi:MAG: hypothetical protein V1866_05285 [archaeon]
MELTNKSLSLLLVAAIVVSLGGTLISLNKLNQGATGLAAGEVNLTITSNTSCNIDTNVTFGTSGKPGGTWMLSTNATNAGYGAFNDCIASATCQGMQINNTGNTNINVTLISNYNASSMLGGPQATQDDFQAKAVNGSAANGGAVHPGCINGALNSTWFYVNESVAARAIPICLNLTWQDANDLLTIEYNVTVDVDTPVGGKTATITITCTQVG